MFSAGGKLNSDHLGDAQLGLSEWIRVLCSPFAFEQIRSIVPAAAQNNNEKKSPTKCLFKGNNLVWFLPWEGACSLSFPPVNAGENSLFPPEQCFPAGICTERRGFFCWLFIRPS